jgi:hypothetical protein
LWASVLVCFTNKKILSHELLFYLPVIGVANTRMCFMVGRRGALCYCHLCSCGNCIVDDPSKYVDIPCGKTMWESYITRNYTNSFIKYIFLKILKTYVCSSLERHRYTIISQNTFLLCLYTKITKSWSTREKNKIM